MQCSAAGGVAVGAWHGQHGSMHDGSAACMTWAAWRRGSRGHACHDMCRLPWTRHGMAWHGMAWHGMAWHGMAGAFQNGIVKHDMRHGRAWHGEARHGVARHVRACRGKQYGCTCMSKRTHIHASPQLGRQVKHGVGDILLAARTGRVAAWFAQPSHTVMHAGPLQPRN